MRGKAIVFGLGVLAALAATTPAKASDTLSCGFEAELSYANGGSGFSSQPGTLNCVGEVDRHTTIGVGTLRLAGTAAQAPTPAGGASCLLGSGFGTIEMTVPHLLTFFDPDPNLRLDGRFDYRHAGSAWEAHGTVDGANGSSGLVMIGLEQDAECEGGSWHSTLSGRILVGGDAAGETARAKGPCANSVPGGPGNDRLSGTRADDLLSGFGGNDRVSGKAGPDCLFGGSGDDVLRAGRGRDAIHCGSGNDVVYTGSGDRVARNCETVRSRR